jgi:hypothetical protein
MAACTALDTRVFVLLPLLLCALLLLQFLLLLFFLLLHMFSLPCPRQRDPITLHTILIDAQLAGAIFPVAGVDAPPCWRLCNGNIRCTSCYSIPLPQQPPPREPVLCHEQLNHNHISVGKRDLIAIATTSGTRTALVGNDTIVSSTEEGAKSMANKRYIAAQHYYHVCHPFAGEKGMVMATDEFGNANMNLRLAAWEGPNKSSIMPSMQNNDPQ